MLYKQVANITWAQAWSQEQSVFFCIFFFLALMFPSNTLKTFEWLLFYITLFTIMGKGDFTEMLPGIINPLEVWKLFLVIHMNSFPRSVFVVFFRSLPPYSCPLLPSLQDSRIKSLCPRVLEHNWCSSTGTVVTLKLCIIGLIRYFSLLIFFCFDNTLNILALSPDIVVHLRQYFLLKT